ncbi:MAG: hypothetical protein H6590_09195 [Flavobacteriales bacterium]|nr:hypothetical protein [Flavobacteriales bacterium]MCB9179581.1 hypothetical protein [Flavobacteriales bacterium]HPF90916.1 hypothetical protein [Flavobacteriales bacterium]
MRGLLLLAVLLAGGAHAQPIDSIHVFARLPAGAWTSASANAQAWKLHRDHAPHRTVKGKDIAIVREAMELYRPERHTFGPLPDLSHVAMLYSGGRPVVLGVDDDLGRVIDLTSRKEYRISTVSEHLQVRALLARLMVE